MEEEELSMSTVVGRSVRTIRNAVPLTQARLAEEVSRYGPRWSQSIVAQVENGNRPVSVDELLALGLALGVAPHLLLYADPGARVTAGEELLSSGELAGWLWSPDLHHRTTFGISEHRRSLLARIEDLNDEDAKAEIARMQETEADQLEAGRDGRRTWTMTFPVRDPFTPRKGEDR